MRWLRLIVLVSISLASTARGVKECSEYLREPVWDDLVKERPDLAPFRPILTTQFKVWNASVMNSERTYEGVREVSNATLTITIHGIRPYEGVRYPSIGLRVFPVAKYDTEAEAFMDSSRLQAEVSKQIRDAIQKTVVATFDFDFQPSVYVHNTSIELSLTPSPTTISFFEFLVDELRK